MTRLGHSKLHLHQPHPFQSWCNVCQRDNSSDWIDARCRYECDRCQRDCESEHAEDELQQQAAE